VFVAGVILGLRWWRNKRRSSAYTGGTQNKSVNDSLNISNMDDSRDNRIN